MVIGAAGHLVLGVWERPMAKICPVLEIRTAAVGRPGNV